MADNPGNLNRYFELVADINASSLNRPIGRDGGSVTNFTGNFEGNGHAITINISSPAQDNVGLFARIGTTGIVRNLEVRGSVNGRDNVGGIAGSVLNTGLITRSSSFVNVNGRERVGGIVGQIDSGGNVNLSFASGDVYATSSRAGGIAGVNSGAVLNSYATGNVEGNHRVGGVVGENNSGQIAFVHALGRITANNNVGGVVGAMNGGTLSNSVALNGNIDGVSQAGRVVGNTGGSMNFNHGRDNMFVDSGPVNSADQSSGHGANLMLATLVPLWWNNLGFQNTIWNFTLMGVPFLVDVPNASAQFPAIPPVATMDTLNFSGFGGMLPPVITLPGGADSAPSLLPDDDGTWEEPDYMPDMKLPEEDEYPEEEDEEEPEEESEEEPEEESEEKSEAEEPPDSEEPGDEPADEGDDDGESEAEDGNDQNEDKDQSGDENSEAEDFFGSLVEEAQETGGDDQTAAIRDILWKNT